MVYIINIAVDGACRRNGAANAIAAAAAVLEDKHGKHTHTAERLRGSYAFRSTNQRAELTAMILGLEMALAKRDNLDTNPRLRVTIRSDSHYAVNAMRDWIYKWPQNGWINTRGREVVNRDLLEKASGLDDRLQELGAVQYVWVPREKNRLADRYCNEELDEMEAES